MTGMLNRARVLALVLVVGAALLCAVASTAQAQQPSFGQNPVLFVHGIEGTGAQFESQKMRFMSNGYPEAWVDELDYDSTRAVGDKSEVDAQIDQAIADLKKSTGRPKVDVVAHSLGTSVMYDYLTGSDGETRKANIGKYVNVDGQDQNPGVPTLAVWAGRGEPGRKMDGAPNVTIPDSTHVQTATSAASFVEYYKFLTGSPPAHDIVPQNGSIEIAGKALDFPRNTGLTDATVEVWQVNDVGRRTTTAPLHEISGIDPTGAWGPLPVSSGTRYEFAIVRPGRPTLHVYYEPFVRSDYAIRLLDSDAISEYAGNRPGAESAVMLRYKELWGDQGAESDQLLINGLNVCAPNVCPISKQVNALFAFDVNRDGKTDLNSLDPALSALPFITGVDVFIPASSPHGTPSGTTKFELVSRGAAKARVLQVPNWDSTADGVIVQWDDFELPVPATSTPGRPPKPTCVRRQRFTWRIHQPRNGRIVKVEAFVDGRRVKTVRGRRITHLRLKRPKHKTNFRVRIVAHGDKGQRTVSVRRYRRCSKTRPHTHTHRPHGHRHH